MPLKFISPYILLALTVAFQTPGKVQVACFQESYAIFCIASKHNLKTRYVWELFGSDSIFPDTPVLYVGQPGIYQCIVMQNDEQVESKLIHVEISPGEKT